MTDLADPLSLGQLRDCSGAGNVDELLAFRMGFHGGKDIVRTVYIDSHQFF